jgi:hypothetical protein
MSGCGGEIWPRLLMAGGAHGEYVQRRVTLDVLYWLRAIERNRKPKPRRKKNGP